jgi:3-phosphoshikimate 1-carboxyvinyltransferase
MATLAGRYNPPVEHDAAHAKGLRPGGAIRGTWSVPGSKSIAQRVVLAASVASGGTRITGLPRGGDVDAALALVESAGARVERLDASALDVPASGRESTRPESRLSAPITIVGRPPGPARGLAVRRSTAEDLPGNLVTAGESGTLARLGTTLLALASEPGQCWRIDARGSLLRRESRALFVALQEAGVGIEWLGAEGAWPVRVRSIGPPSAIRIVHPRSSQEVSALVLAAAAWPGEIVIEVVGDVPSRPYLDLTREVLARFGARVGGDLVVRGPLVAPADPVAIEADASSAAVLLAAGCLSGGRVVAKGLARDSAQPDARSVEILERFGCRTGWDEAGPFAEGSPGRGAEVDCGSTPDLAPVLASIAAAAALHTGAKSVLSGLGTLAGKESDRIAVLERGLTQLGFEVRVDRDRLAIGPGLAHRNIAPTRLDPASDHRMAFAFALLGLVIDGVFVLDPGCVAKSWPGFWEDLSRLGGTVAEESTASS